MRKKILMAATFLGCFILPAIAAENIGVVNFTTCITDSKAGKKEQESLESLRKQMVGLIENTEKELKELSAKFEDSEFLDSLSPKAEEDLKIKLQTLNEDLGRYQNQYYQVLNQANYQLIQRISGTIAKAAEKVASTNKLDYVMNREACFYIRPDLDVTKSVIIEMDKTFEVDSKNRSFSDNTEEAPQDLNGVDETILKQAG